ncbi:MAG: Sensor histidine kinase LiaS [Candidatus Accumulibacter vicinus]|uniref:histidine kinase n=2 Tax=Candidatus Accumulibacter vicinus TaxID=2954382 RepID=A0A084Y5M0_9PROT|nr:MAG: Sensor histidine kinase LiaS [Candidatus Accumulibacter vicinus]
MGARDDFRHLVGHRLFGRLAAMIRPRTESLLRFAGLSVWLLVGVSQAASAWPPLPGVPRLAYLAVQGLVFGLLAVFAICFWLNMRAIPADGDSRHRLLLLLVQAVSGLLIATDLMYIVAAEAPLVLASRRSLQWLAGQTVVMVLWSLLLAHSGVFEGLTALQARPAETAFAVTLLSVLAWQFFAFCAGWFAAGESRGQRELARLNGELVAAQRALAEASRLEERLHIARELHDTAGHHLVALKLQLDLAQRVAEPARPSHVANAAAIARQLLEEVRVVVGRLRERQDVDLVQALADLRTAIPEPELHVEVAAELADELAFLPADLKQILYRCIQEAVNNALCHADARHLRITLGRTNGDLGLRIRDDGRGVACPRAGHGLTGMAERIAALGGDMTFVSAPGEGFQIDIRVPIDREGP